MDSRSVHQNRSSERPSAWAVVVIQLREIDDAVLYGERVLIFLSLSLMVGCVFFESVFRWVSNEGISGVSEGARFLMVVVGFLGASVATAEKKHLVVDIVARMLYRHPRVVHLLGGVAWICAMILVGFLGWSAAVYMKSPGVAYRVSTALELKLEYAVAVMPMALFTMWLRFSLLALEEFSMVFGWLPQNFERSTEDIASFTGERELDATDD